MALTKVTTGGITDATVATADIADNAVTAGKLASGVQTTINNNADNRVITGSGTANTLEGESDLIFDGTKLGIGMTPSTGTGYVLQLDSGAAQTFMTFGNSGSGNGALNGLVVGNDTSRAYFTQRENQPIHIATNNTDCVAIDSSGRVGIGTTSPEANLHVHTDSNDTGITVKSTGNTSNAFNIDANRSGANAGIGGIKGRWNGTTVAQLGFNTGSDTTNKDDGYVWFGTETAASNGNVNATERMRIVSNGEVGINVTDPEAYGANGHGYAGLTVEAPSGNYSGITIRSNYAGAGQLAFSDGSGSAAELKNIALQADHVNKRLTVLVDNAGVARFSANGFHPNPADSAAANALDDYEEGNWTATVYWSSSNTTGGYTNTTTVTGSYTKIGGVVTVTVSVNPATMNSGSNCWISYISLPFAPSASWAAAFAPYSGRGNYGGTLDRDLYNVPYAQFSTSNGGTVVPLVTGMGRGAGYWGHYSGDSSASAKISGSYMTNS